MPKILILFVSLLKSAMFKNKNQYNVISREFDIFKVSIFLYICLSVVFSVYTLQYIAEQKSQIEKLEKKYKASQIINDCISTEVDDYLDLVALTKAEDVKIITIVKKCLRPKT